MGLESPECMPRMSGKAPERAILGGQASLGQISEWEGLGVWAPWQWLGPWWRTMEITKLPGAGLRGTSRDTADASP